MIERTLGRLAAGDNLSLEETAAAIDDIMQGHWSESQIALLLNGLRLKGETVDEIAGAALAMRRHMAPIASRREGVIDTCGTGGTSSKAFNISTTAAIVAAAAGAPVAKHGNRKVTSNSGSADVLAQLGVNLDAGVECVTACLDELGVCFCFAPLLHAAMRHVAPVRQKLGVRTIFNMLGPLTNPAGAPFQLLGVGRDELRPLLAAALARLGTRRAAVVRGADGLGEVSLAGETRVTEVRDGKLREFVWTPADFGLERASLESIEVAGPEQSAALVREVLAGRPGVARDIVLMNAAAALWVAGRAATLPSGVEQAAAAIDSGAARELLARLVERTNAAE
ncbi:MAG TPA: anthranilate phosphoribosyltransferase [Pirellulales bacterium]|nr:anthranilate phosphoribosyltransferase [Pirellulales bacterium]